MGSTLLKLYLPALVVFLILDALWLGVVARGFYREQFGDLMRPDVRWGAALLFYLLFIGAVLVFVVGPALDRGSLGQALRMGAFFGLVAYATYDLTNLAVLRGFSCRSRCRKLAHRCVGRRAALLSSPRRAPWMAMPSEQSANWLR